MTHQLRFLICCLAGVTFCAPDAVARGRSRCRCICGFASRVSVPHRDFDQRFEVGQLQIDLEEFEGLLQQRDQAYHESLRFGGIRIPATSFDLPEIRPNGFTRYRRGPDDFGSTPPNGAAVRSVPAISVNTLAIPVAPLPSTSEDEVSQAVLRAIKMKCQTAPAPTSSASPN